MATKIVKTLKFPNNTDEFQINAVRLGGKTLEEIEAEIPTIPDFTDTDTTYDLAASKSSTNGNVKLNLTAEGSGSGTDSVTIEGSGATSVTTDENGVITISSTDTYHTPLHKSGIKIATGTSGLAMYVPTGTDENTVALGNHTHSDITKSVEDLASQVNDFLDVDDTTKDQLSEIIALIEGNTSLQELADILAQYVKYSDIIDNLTSTYKLQPLSANQGKVLKDLIDNIEFGTRNLLVESGNERNHAYNNNSVIRYEFTEAPTAGDSYILSFDAKTSNGTDVCYVSITNNTSTVTRIYEFKTGELTTNYQRFSLKIDSWASQTNDSICFIHYTAHGTPYNKNNTGTLSVKNIKLERGNNTATDWLPAPEDVETALTEKADKEHNHNNLYYTKEQIDNMELITPADIDTICGTIIQDASNNSEVTF